MTTKIHPTAVVESDNLVANVTVGPFCYIGPNVSVDEGTKFGPHCVVHGPTKIGKHNNFYAQCSIGGDSQAIAGHDGNLEIGDNNTVREFVTINRGTKQGSTTKLGSNNLLMACSHVAHDCDIANHVIIANAVLIGGEVVIGDKVVLGGAVAVHQQCRVGELAIIGGVTAIRQDVVPYANYVTSGDKVAFGINRIGLQRAGLGDEVSIIKQAYNVLFYKGLSFEKAKQELQQQAQEHKILQPLSNFIEKVGKFGLVRPRTK